MSRIAHRTSYIIRVLASSFFRGHLWLSLLCTLSSGEGTPPPAEPSWKAAAQLNGVDYQTAEELRSFYKLNTANNPRRKGAYAISDADVILEFGPAANDISISGVRLSPLFPLVHDSQGRLMISRADWVYWIDPILRPTYVTGREEVQTVIIDAGHGGHDQGEQTPGGSEAQFSLLMAEELQNHLQAKGLRAMLTRSGDYFLSDQQRVDAANMYPGAIFISLHLNAASAERRGPEVYLLSPLAPPGNSLRPAAAYTARSAALAFAVQSALSTAAGSAGGGCRYVHFSLLCSLNMPSVWVELGYASNQQEAALLATAAYREKLAEALARAVVTYAGITSPQGKLKVSAPPPKPSASPKSNPPSAQPPPQRTKRDSASSSNSGNSRRNNRRRR